MKLILIVGPSQSGSTLLFNMVRILLVKYGYTVDACWYTLYKQGAYNTHADVVIVKCHFFDENLCQMSDIILLPLRDFRDSAVSCHKRYHSLNTPHDYATFVLQNIGQFESWLPYATYVFKYEQYMNAKETELKEVGKVLNIEVSQELLTKTLPHLEELHTGTHCPDTDILPQQEYRDLLHTDFYRSTLCTKSHNTSGGKIGKYCTDIPKDCLAEIHSNLIIRTFLKFHGYHIVHSCNRENNLL